MSTRVLSRAVGFVAVATSLFMGAESRAATIIRDPNPPRYKVEIEPHLNIQYFWFDAYGAHGIGPGVRFGIPIVSPGFIKRLNNSVAISFGADFLYYTGRDHCESVGGGQFVCSGGRSFWVLYA